MKNLKTINALLLIVGTFAVSSAANADSLLEVYQQALQSDPLIHEAEARRLAALEAKPQARGVLLPQINANGNWMKFDSEGSSFSLGLNRTVDVTQSTDQQDFGIELTQTLFRWNQIVNLRRADKIVAKAEALRESAQQDLVIRVAQRYFDVLAAEDRLTSIHADRTAIARQLEQAKQRFEVGLIAITDVQESQAAYDQSVANEIGAKRSLATARNFLREITGEYTSSLSAPKEDFPLQLPEQSERDGSTCRWIKTSTWWPVAWMRNWRATKFRSEGMVITRRLTWSSELTSQSVTAMAQTTGQPQLLTRSSTGIRSVCGFRYPFSPAAQYLHKSGKRFTCIAPAVSNCNVSPVKPNASHATPTLACLPSRVAYRRSHRLLHQAARPLRPPRPGSMSALVPSSTS